jgi:hypothetical protein
MNKCGGVEVLPPPFLTSALDEGEWSASRPGRFTPGERFLGTHWIGGLVGPTASVEAVCPCWESNPGRPAPYRSSYTEYEHSL